MTWTSAPAARHLELYRYWDSRRHGRRMPARQDLDPADLRALLPHLTLIDVEGERFRYRLVGSAVVQDLGREMTGTYVGSHVTPPEYAKAICHVYERVVASRAPIFTTGQYQSKSMLIHAVSRLLLPLSEDGGQVNMIVVSRSSRFNHQLASGINWIGEGRGQMDSIVEVGSAEQVHALTLAWERELEGADAVA